MQKSFKKAIASFLVVLMLLTSVPLNGFVGMDWSAFVASAAEENIISSLKDMMSEKNEGNFLDFPNKFEEDKADFSEFAEKVKDEAENVFSLMAEKKVEQTQPVAKFPLKRSVVPASEETDFSWDYDEETHTLTVRGTGDMPDYTEMLEQEGVPTPIAPWAEYAKEIEKVVIEAGITSVGDCAFALCTNLKEVVLPEGITSIGAGAFAYCVELVDINLPSTLISVDQMALGMCWSVKELVLPDSIETIGDMAFMYMFDLEKINLPASLQDNGEGMFTYALSLKELVVPEGLKIEAVYDISEFLALSLEHITNYSATFAIDLSFEDLLGGYFDSLEYAEAFAYLYKNYFKYEFTGEEAAMLGIEISEQELIEDTINYFNTNLATNYAVADFESFEHVLAIVEEAIYAHIISGDGCPSYFSVSCLEDSKQHELCRDNAISHDIIGEEENCVCFVMNGTIGDNITWSVDAETKTLTFDGLGEMADFDDVPEYVKYSAYIENISFAEGSDITSIGDYAFYGLTNLETISLPEGITALGERCFYNSGVKILNLPASLNSTETLSFYTGTAPLEEINVAEGNEKFLSYEGSLYSEYVEYEGEMTYILLKQPEKHAGEFVDNTIGFFYCAFENYSTVTEITVPDTVLIITEGAFLTCSALKTINIGNSKIYEADGETASLEIEDDFVAYCNNLTAINVDERNINYSSIDGVLYNKNVTEIITVPMGLNEVTVPETVTAIPRYAFDYDKLQKVTFLNPSCEIREEYSAINRDATICGYKDSTAEAYADTFSRKFEYIGDITITGVDFDFTDAKKEYSQFDSLDTTGIKVTIHFSDGTSSIKTSGFQVTGFNSDKTGEKVLTVTYRSYSETYSVTVTEPFFPAQGGYKYFYIDPGETIFVGFTPEETKSLCLNMTGYDGNTEYYVTVYEEDKQTVIYNGILDYSNPVPIYSYEAGKTYYFAFSHNRTDYDHYLSVELVQSHDYYVSSSEDATCTEDGYVTYTCRTCGDSYTEYIWALGHNMVETVVSSATCTSDGEGIAECSRCDYSYDLTYTRLGHKDENSDEICDACSEGILSISVGETKNIQVSQGEYVYIKFVPTESGRYKFYSISSDDTYGYLYDTNMNQLYSSDDDGEAGNFSITYEFESGETYWWGVRYYNSDYSGSFDVTLECGHSGEWETVTEPTCTSVGSKTCVCVQCGKTVTEEIPTLSHNYELTETVPATCTEYGYERYDCTGCDDYYIDDIYSLGHDYIYTTTKEATCTETGVESVTCGRCDYTDENTIAKTMHTDDNSDAVCDVCEAEILYISIDETKSITVNEGETVYIKFVPAEAGRYSFYSDAYEDTYGYLYDSNMNLLSSDDDDGEDYNFLITYDFEAGKVYYFGARYYSSSDSGSFDVTLECAHDGEWEIVTQATCATVGSKTCVCVQCGKTVTEEIPTIPHNYELTETVLATCTEDGYERYDCTGCDEYYTDTLYSSGHEYVYTVTKEATCSEEGKQTVTCSKCDYSEENEIAKIRCTDADNDYICDICGTEVPHIFVGETQNVEVAEGETVYIKYIPSVSGTYKFYSTASTDTYGYLYDADMNHITYNDDGGEGSNFLITYDFEAGKVYYFGVRYYSSSNSGSFDIILECSHLDVEYDGICDRCGASSSVASGTCGENLIWNIYGTTLVISGIGDMDDYYYISTDSRASWYPYLSGITNIIIQNGVTSIGSTAFADGYNVTDVTIPDSVTHIGETAFYRCYNLKNAMIPEGVQIIDDDAFCMCNSLTNVIIPESVTTIGEQAFRDCSNLTTIRIPESVTSIGDGAFSECYNLENIVVSDNNSNYSSDENGVLFDKNKSTIICYPAGAANEYVIPDTVVTIGDNSFFGCNNLTNITISDNVTSIGYMSFFGCTNLTNITISNNVKVIGYQAFDDCYNLERIVINNFDCEITDSEYTIYSGAVIYGHENSTAQAYAEKYGRSFVATPCEAVFIEEKDATCTEKGNIAYYSCSVCGLYYSDENCTTRIDEADVFIDELGHDYGGWVVNKEPTCTEDGEQRRGCSRCDAIETGVVDATGHTVGELTEEVLPTCTEEGYTKGVCLVCGEEFENSVAALGHTYSGEWETAQELTCVTDGIKVKTCITCGEKSGLVGITAEDFPKCIGTDYTHYMDTTFDSYSVPNASKIVLHFSADSYLESGYDYIYVYAGDSAVEENLVGRYTGSLADTIVNVNASSFTIRMTTDQSVTKYGFEISSIDYYNSDNVEITPAPGHNYGDWETVTEATCTTSGAKERVCAACNDKQTETISAFGHSYGEWITKSEATCENNGIQEKTCGTCGDVVTNTLPALGHSYSLLEMLDATCTENGADTFICERCENEYTKTFSPRHRDSDDDGFCDFCNEPYVGVLDLVFVIDTTGSMGSEISVVKKNIINYANRLANSNIPYYIAVVDYRDFSDRADNEDYPYSVVLDFSDSNEDILSGVNKLSLGNGGDTEETVYSGLVNGLNELHWGENSVRKVILIGDAAPLDPEPNTDFTLYSTCEYLNSNNTSVYSISTGGSEVSEFAEIAEATGGESYVCSSDSAFNQVLTDIIDSIPESLHIHTYEESYTDATCTRGGITTYHCTGCGKDISTETEPLGHNFSEEWTVDTEPTCTENGSKSHHCSRCDEKSDVTEIEATGHNYESVIAEPTCTEKGYTTHTCSVCGSGYTDSIVNELGHSYSDWNETKAPTCTETGLEERVCSRCSDVDEQIVDALGHDYSEEWTVDKEATCTEDGSKSHHCSRCDDKTDITVIEAHGHDYESVITEPNCTEDGYTTHTCSVCEDTYTDTVVDALGHAYSDWSVTTQPTCTKTGVEKHTCSRCGKVESQTVDALGHDYSEEWTIDKEATCTEDGSKSHHCIRCDDKADVTVIEKLGHAYSEWVVTIEPTCTKTGVEKRTCSRCGNVESQVVDALGHGYSEEWTVDKEATCTIDGSKSHHCTRCDDKTDVTVIEAHGHEYESVITEPTCTKDGYTTHTCSICEDTYTDTVVDALGHTYGEWVVTTEPTCIKTGVEKRTCSRCDNVESQTVEALGHDYSEEWTVDKESTCAEDGSKSHHCTRCDDKADVTALPKGEHKYKAFEVVYPTCTAQGYTKYRCSICKEVKNDDYEDAVGHSFGEWFKVNDPDCVNKGKSGHTCTVCNTTEYSYVDSLGHNWSKWSVSVEPTVLADGKETRNCSRCNKVVTKTISKIEVDITENENYGLAHFTVVDAQTLEPIEGASIFISTENDGENTFFTDAEGKVSIILPVGKQTIQAYAEGCHVRSLKVTINPGEQTLPNIGLSGDELVDAEVTVTEMTLEEILEAGIDVNAEDNKQYYKWSLTCVFDAVPEFIFEYVTDSEGNTYYTNNDTNNDTNKKGPGYSIVVTSEGEISSRNSQSTNVGVRPVANLGLTGYSKGDKFNFGYYPQTQVTSESLIDSLNSQDIDWEAYEVYCGDGEDVDSSVITEIMYYADVEYNGSTYRAIKNIEYRPALTYTKANEYNSYQDNNGYYTDNVYWFKYEPISWIVLEQNADSVFVISENALDSQSRTVYKQDFELKEWLNNEFALTAFTTEERSKIITTKVSNCWCGEHSFTYEKLYFISEKDVALEDYGFQKYNEENVLVPNYEMLCTKGTDYSLALGIYDDTWEKNEYEAWWIRGLGEPSGSGGGGGGFGGGGGGFRGTGGNGTPFTIYPMGGGEEELFYLVIWGEVSWLKEMFDVEMVVINRSKTDTIENCVATLDIPDGLSLATMVGQQQTLAQNIGHIDSDSTETVHWYIRGDKEGNYNVRAKLEGTLMPFEENFSYDYEAKDSVRVYAGSAMHMTFTIPDGAYEGHDAVVTIELENVSDKTLYNVSSKITDVFQFDSYYLQGDEGGLYYHTKGGEKVPWESGYAEKFEPGDKIVLEVSTNILFHSRMYDKLAVEIGKIEKLKKMYDSLQALIDVSSGFIGLLDLASKNIDKVISEGAEIAGECYSALASEISKLYTKLDGMPESEVAQIAVTLINSDVWGVIEGISSGDWTPNMNDAETIIKTADKIKTIVEEKEDYDDPFGLIQDVISLLPVRYRLIDAYVETRDGSTTEIPYTIETYHVESPYKGVINMGKIMMDTVITGMGEIDTGMFKIFGISDPTGFKDSYNSLKTELGKLKALRVRAGVEDTRVKAWVVPAKAKTRSASLNAEDFFTLSITENDTAEIVNGVLEFTGNATLNVTALSEVGGTLYVDMGDGDVFEYEIEVVEEHECSSEEWVTLLSASKYSDSYQARYCDICDELIDYRSVEACEKHSVGEWTTESEANCTVGGVATRTCSSCGYEETSFIDATGHTEKTINKVDATCTADGYTGDVICEVCEETISVGEAVVANGHSYEAVITAPTCTADGYTTNTCSVCQDSYISDVTEKLGHTGGTANCEDKAICTVCGEAYGEINPDNHKNVVTDKAVSATCTSTGLTEGIHCDTCGKVIVAQTTTEKLSHTEEIIPAVNSTCTKTGFTEGKKCSVCGEILVKQTETSKLEHSYKSVITAPTCTNGGYTTYTCSVCKHAYKANETAKLGHNMGSFIVVEQPSCTENGLEIAECSRCDYSEVNELSASGHNYQDGVCTECGDSKSNNCSCNCHKTGFMGFIWKILRFFYKLFGMNKVCSCGVAHY